MNVLVACEESQEVCKAFRVLGHEAYSCDIQECSGVHPEWHICGDVLPLINGNCWFTTSDLHTHTRRAVGSDYRASAMHGSGRQWSTTLRAEAEGRSAAKIHRVFHADGACSL